LPWTPPLRGAAAAAADDDDRPPLKRFPLLASSPSSSFLGFGGGAVAVRQLALIELCGSVSLRSCFFLGPAPLSLLLSLPLPLFVAFCFELSGYYVYPSNTVVCEVVTAKTLGTQQPKADINCACLELLCHFRVSLFVLALSLQRARFDLRLFADRGFTRGWGCSRGRACLWRRADCRSLSAS
jgi:hypothetical protein